MKLETLKQRITENVKGKYTFEIQPLNTLNWKLTRIICYCPKHNHKWETAVTSPLYRGSGCPICAKEITASKKRTSIATIQNKLAKIEVEKNLVVTSQIQDVAIDIQRVQVKCKIHNIEWESTLGAIMRGNTKCRQCSSIDISKKRMETKESLNKRLYTLYNSQNIEFELIGDYKGAKKTKIKCKCNICGYKWERGNLVDLLRIKSGCPNCKNKAKGLRNRTPLDEITQKLQEASNGRYTFEILSFETQKDSQIKCTCLKCNNEWRTTYGILIRGGCGCPRCANTIMAQKVAEQTRTPYNEIIQRLNAVLIPKNIQFTLLEQNYKNQNTIIECYCTKHNHRWNAKIHTLLGTTKRDGTGCFYCGKEATAEQLKQPLDVIIQRLESEANGEYTFKLDSYTNMHQNIECQCTLKGHIWYPRISDLLLNHSKCPHCAFSNGSKQEKEILEFVKGLVDCDVVENSRQIIPPQELDIYIPELKLAFEYNGEYWHSDNIINSRSKGKFESAQAYHDYKTEQCKQKGIELIHINEQEYITDKQKVLYLITKEINNARTL